MRFFVAAVGLAGTAIGTAPSLIEVDRWLKRDPNSPEMLAARKEEVSFMENTLHAMEFNQQEVLKSNKDLDKQVRDSERRLKQITAEVSKMTKETRERMDSVLPFSLLQTGGLFDDGDDEIQSAMNAILRPKHLSQNEVIAASKDLNKQLRADQLHLKRVTSELKKETDAIVKKQAQVFPVPSFLETTRFRRDPNDDDDDTSNIIAGRLGRDSGDDDDDGTSTMKAGRFDHSTKSTVPMNALEVAKARALASEKRFEQAMKKLSADREALLADERMRRARAQQERHHLQI
jgi:hypothetical protein